MRVGVPREIKNNEFRVAITPSGVLEFVRRGHTVVIDYKPGAGGVLAATELTRAAPDGYTLLIANVGPFAIAPYVQSKKPYDPVTQFSYIGQIAETPYVAATRPEHPARDLKQFVDWARANAGKVSFASGGPGSSTHLCGELLNSEAGLDMLHVPYKGSAPAVQDVIGGQIPMSFETATVALPHVQSGKVRALAVTSAKRSKVLPEVPTLQEAGIAGFDVASWQALYAPAGTPAAVVQRVNAEIEKILATAEVKTKMDGLGLDHAANTPEQFAAFGRNEMAKWQKVVKDGNVKPE